MKSQQSYPSGLNQQNAGVAVSSFAHAMSQGYEITIDLDLIVRVCIVEHGRI